MDRKPWLMLAVLLAHPLGVATSAHADVCASVPKTEIPLPQGASNSYVRVHPTGNFILTSNPVQLVDLRQRPPKVIDLPQLNQEAIFVYSKDTVYVASPMHPSEQPGAGRASGEDLQGVPMHERAEYYARNQAEEMRYFRLQDLLSQGEKAQPARVRDGETGKMGPFVDTGVTKWYQSVGELPGSTPSKRVIRMSDFDGPLRFRDITVTTGPDGVATVTKGPVLTLCGNIRGADGREIAFHSPILSPDGTEVSFSVGIGYGNTTTRIYKLEANGNCTQVDDLGYTTSKGWFSYPKPGSKGQFVFTASSSELQGSSPAAGYMTRAYVYDRDTKKTTALDPDMQDGESVLAYPMFTADGRIMYVKTVPGAITEPGSYRREDPKSVVVILDPPQAGGLPTHVDVAEDRALAACFGGKPDEYFNTLSALGSLWKELCRKSGINEEGIRWKMLSLNRDECRAMVQQNYAAWRSRPEPANEDGIPSVVTDRTKFSLDALLAACEKPTASGARLDRAPSSLPGNASAEQIIAAKCQGCHAAGDFDFQNPDHWYRRVSGSHSRRGTTFKDEMLRRIAANAPAEIRVPPPSVGQLTDSERETLRRYLESLPAPSSNAGRDGRVSPSRAEQQAVPVPQRTERPRPVRTPRRPG